MNSLSDLFSLAQALSTTWRRPQAPLKARYVQHRTFLELLQHWTRENCVVARLEVSQDAHELEQRIPRRCKATDEGILSCKSLKKNIFVLGGMARFLVFTNINDN